jgi:hypothetical protein
MSRTDANWAAGLTVAFCGLLRGAEFSLQEGEKFDPNRHLTRADVKFFSKEGVEYAILGRENILQHRRADNVPSTMDGFLPRLNPEQEGR